MNEISYCSPEISDLAKAMIKVQQELQPINKDSFNPFTKSKFASLPLILEGCRNVLLKNQIWLTQYPVPAEPNTLGLVTKLVHAPTGQFQASLAIVPLPKDDPQGFGIACTYTRRYMLASMLGLIIDEDTDGESQPTQERQGKLKPHQIAVQKRSEPTPAEPSLPQLDGVTYETVYDKNNREIILARGKTYAVRADLSSAGFKYNPEFKYFWRYAA